MSAKSKPGWSAARPEIERLIFDIPGFRSCTIRFSEPDEEGNNRAVLRPVILQDREMLQLTLSGERESRDSNLGTGKSRRELRALIAKASHLHLMSDSVDIHARVTRKGQLLFSRSKPLKREPLSTKAHDRKKNHPLDRIDSSLLLRAIGFSDSQDRIRPSMQAKYRQVNEFLRIIDAALPASSIRGDKPLRFLDAGCGKAYLTLAAQAYLAMTRPFPVEWCGVDMREDVIQSARAIAERLRLEPPAASFVVADLGKFEPSAPPDVVVSLHACDTATDEAIARGIEWGASAIISVPCCQRQIQPQLKTDGPQNALLRHGILKERLADLLADAFRAQILRLLGYRVRVVEFVEPEATARNVLLRAERGVRPGMARVAEEYLELREAWGVVPPLETRLADRLGEYLG